MENNAEANGSGNPAEPITVNDLPRDFKEAFVLKRNMGDGHCFYYTILRYIYDHPVYFNTVHIPFDGQIIPVSALVPEDFAVNSDDQRPRMIVNLRRALAQFAASKGDIRLLHKSYFERTCLAQNNRGCLGKDSEKQGMFAGVGIAGADEFQYMAMMLRACLVIRIERPGERSIKDPKKRGPGIFLQWVVYAPEPHIASMIAGPIEFQENAKVKN